MTNVVSLRVAIEPQIYYATKGFRLDPDDPKDLEGFPFVTDSKGLLVEPVHDYLAEGAYWQNKAIGTLCDEAGALKDWWSFLTRAKKQWTEANDALLRAWCKAQEGKIEIKRITRKLNVVFDFYFVAQTRFGIIQDLMEDPESGKVGEKYPISVNVISRRGSDGNRVLIYRPRYRYTTIPSSINGGRPTPSREEAKKVLDTLLDQEDPYKSARDWLFGKWMLETGLRRKGVTSLTLQHLSQMLSNDGITDLSSAVTVTPAVLDRIQAKLRAIKAKGRQGLYMKVTEKRSTTGEVRVPFELISLTLEFVCDHRAELIAKIRSRRPNYTAPDQLWLSAKNGKALKAGSIGDQVKDAFNLAEVKGSGHRLRAAFAIEVLRDEYLKARAAFGRMWDPRTVLQRAAERLRHKDLKSLKFYLNHVIREFEAIEGHPIFILDKANPDLFRGIADAVNAGNTELLDRIEQLAGELKIEPKPEVDSIEQLRQSLELRKAQLAEQDLAAS